MHGFTTGRRIGSLMLGTALAACLAALAVRAQSQDYIKQSLVVPGDPKPIMLYADQITTWAEKGQRIFLLQGGVRVEQGLNNLRVPRAVVWVDEEGKKKSGVYRVDVYGDGKAELEQGPRRSEGKQAFLEMATRGEVRIKSYGNKVIQQALPKDVLYQKGTAERAKNKTAPDQNKKEQKKTTAGLPPKTGGVTTAPFSGPPAGPDSLQKTGGPLPPKSLPDTTELPPAVFPSDNKVTALQPPPSPFPSETPGPTEAPAPVLGAPPGTVAPPDGAPAPALPKTLTIRPRTSQELQARNYPLPDGYTAVVISSPVILSVSSPAERKGLLDIEADRVVVWTKGDSQQLITNMQGPQGETTRTLEFYLSGNVEIRNQSGKETQILRADEVYYDVGRSVALALRGDLEVKDPGMLYPLHFKAEQIQQLNPKLFKGVRTEVFASALPSDPGLKVQVMEATLEERQVKRRTIFGLPFIDRKTGEQMVDNQRIFRGKNMILRLESFPVFYFPYIQGDIEDPLGPLEAVGFNYNNIFGFQLFTSWNIYDLIGITPVPGTRWRLFADEMTLRGPALGSEFDFGGHDLFGIQNKYQGMIKAYGMRDVGLDNLGGGRGENAFIGPTTAVPIVHPEWRGRFLAKLSTQELPYGFSFQGQVSLLSDRNFLEQFFNREYNQELNQETFAYLKQQQEHWAWTLLAEDRTRQWITETEWFPKLDGYLIGLKFFDLFTYNMHANAGYARLRTTDVPSFAYLPTDVATNTGRFDLYNDISLPLNLGAFKVVPYLVGDAAYYTQDIFGNDRGRLYGGGGVRGSVPLSRLYGDVSSDLFNLDSLFHKIVLSGNYFVAESSDSLRAFPQLDRLNDDISDQALRDIRPRQPVLNPTNAAFLTSSSLFDPQIYALRRLIDNRMDTLDTIDVFQANIRQRLQTKRGFPTNQHVIDWMTLDVGFSVFPHSTRDNFGQTFGIINYDWIWNIGDRTALVSDGWFETTDGGPHVFNFGAIINRPDRTNLYLGYRQIDPLQSRALIGSVTFPFNAKYALTASTNYDFGVHNRIDTITLTRIGSDLQMSLGINYNSILKTFGVTFNIVPNILPNRGAPGTNLASTLAQQTRR